MGENVPVDSKPVNVSDDEETLKEKRDKYAKAQAHIEGMLE